MGKRSVLLAAVVLIGVMLWKIALDGPPEADEQSTGAPNAPSAPETQSELYKTSRAGPSHAEQAEAAKQTTPTLPPQPAAAAQQQEVSVALPPPKRSGPVAMLQQAFEEEPRDSAAHDPESRIESEFRKSDVAPGTLKSTMCRKSVCRVTVHWTPERALSFMAAFTRLSADFDPGIAIDPHDIPGSPQQLEVDVYLPRRGSRASSSDH